MVCWCCMLSNSCASSDTLARSSGGASPPSGMRAASMPWRVVSKSSSLDASYAAAWVARLS
eukprot:7960181-Pyramimonas_sp.AAC.1